MSLVSCAVSLAGDPPLHVDVSVVILLHVDAISQVVVTGVDSAAQLQINRHGGNYCLSSRTECRFQHGLQGERDIEYWST